MNRRRECPQTLVFRQALFAAKETKLADHLSDVGSLRTVARSALIDRFEKCVDELRDAVSGLSTKDLRARPIEGKWSSLEVVCHIADTEIYFTDRIERTLALDNPLLMGVDERPYTEKLQFQEQSVDEELELFSILRKRTARILRRQSDEVWNRTAVHSSNGLCTLEDIVVKAITHVQHHLPFIAEKRRALLAQTTASATSKPAHQYCASIDWSNAGPDFLTGKYSREHIWRFDHGIQIKASPSPYVVPAPWSSESAVDPEEALVASAASCHMLTFLWLASKRKLAISHYTDDAAGIMTKNANGIPWVSKITLRPKITWSGPSEPDPATIDELHHQAHEQCFIANSIKSQISIEPPT